MQGRLSKDNPEGEDEESRAEVEVKAEPSVRQKR
jgi:hypothetical protein